MHSVYEFCVILIHCRRIFLDLIIIFFIILFLSSSREPRYRTECSDQTTSWTSELPCFDSRQYHDTPLFQTVQTGSGSHLSPAKLVAGPFTLR